MTGARYRATGSRLTRLHSSRGVRLYHGAPVRRTQRRGEPVRRPGGYHTRPPSSSITYIMITTLATSLLALPATPRLAGPCDLFEAAGTPCVAGNFRRCRRNRFLLAAEPLSHARSICCSADCLPGPLSHTRRIICCPAELHLSRLDSCCNSAQHGEGAVQFILWPAVPGAAQG